MGTVFMVSTVHCALFFPLRSYLSLIRKQWNILYGGSIPVTVYVSEDNIVQGYDFWGLERRTYVITRFFNIDVGTIGSDVFGFPG